MTHIPRFATQLAYTFSRLDVIQTITLSHAIFNLVEFTFHHTLFHSSVRLIPKEIKDVTANIYAYLSIASPSIPLKFGVFGGVI